MTLPDRLLARLARQGGSRLLDAAIAKALPDRPTPGRRKGNLLSELAGIVAMRVATRSVPGAIIVTSGLVAKTLHDRRKARKAGKSGSGPAGQKDAAGS